MTKRILLVDDEPQLLFSVREYLVRLGYDVTSAENGAEALALLVQGPPDLIISDILMEEMDGFEFQRRVSALTGSGIPFIFLTAKGDLKDRLDGLHGGADDYITKPFEPEELQARIAAVIHRVDQTRNDERRELDSLRTRILAEVAGRLRTPITSLVAQISVVLSNRFGEDGTEQARFLKSALQDATVLSELISDLSWAAADIASEPTLSREPTRVAPIVRSAAASAARLASEKGVDLRISCGGLLSGNIDAAAMTRALSSLLESAVGLSPPGSQVSISASRAREGGLEFSIQDGGIADLIEGDLPTDVADALEYTRRIVKAHAGRIAIRQEEESQSLTIWLPGRIAKHIGRRKQASG